LSRSHAEFGRNENHHTLMLWAFPLPGEPLRPGREVL